MTTVTPPAPPPADLAPPPPIVAGPRLRATIRWVGAAFTVVTLLVTAFRVLTAIAYDQHLEVVTFTAAELAPVEVVDVSNSTGDVVVQASATDEIRLSSDVADGLFRARHDHRIEGGSLRVRTSCPLGFATRCRVDHHLVVPGALGVEVTGRMGDIEVGGVGGPLDLDGAFGQLTVEGATGPLRIAHRFGAISAHRLASPTVEVSNHFGEISLSFATAPRDVQVTSRFGTTVVELPDDGAAYRITGSTGMGDRSVEVRVDPGSERRIHLDTVFGDVTVRYAR